MKVGHILYIYAKPIPGEHSFYADPPEFNIIPTLKLPDHEPEYEEEHTIV